MSGGGVNEENIKDLFLFTKTTSFHASARKLIDSNMIFRKNNISMGLPQFSEYELKVADKEGISKMFEAANSLR